MQPSAISQDTAGPTCVLRSEGGAHKRVRIELAPPTDASNRWEDPLRLPSPVRVQAAVGSHVQPLAPESLPSWSPTSAATLAPCTPMAPPVPPRPDRSPLVPPHAVSTGSVGVLDRTAMSMRDPVTTGSPRDAVAQLFENRASATAVLVALPGAAEAVELGMVEQGHDAAHLRQREEASFRVRMEREVARCVAQEAVIAEDMMLRGGLLLAIEQLQDTVVRLSALLRDTQPRPERPCEPPSGALAHAAQVLQWSQCWRAAAQGHSDGVTSGSRCGEVMADMASDAELEAYARDFAGELL